MITYFSLITRDKQSVDSSDKLRDRGLKATSPRLRILHFLEHSSTRHWSAERLYQALSQVDADIGLATLYRVLMQFEQAGLLEKHQFDGGHAVYELASEEHHDHLICVGCGVVREFLDPEIEARQDAIAAEEGFVVTDHSLVIYGLCTTCRTGEA
jgi:Fur family transcriptional regulator, ferric uptake regulator